MEPEPRLFRVAVVLLAAGASRRMGRPKLLLPWGATSVLGHLLSQWEELGVRDLAVVTAAGDPCVPAELDRLGRGAVVRIVNAEPARGMFRSIQTAAAWGGWPVDLSHVVLSLGDQPQVRTSTLRGLLAFAAGRPERICQLSREGRGRHPVVFPRARLAELAGAPGPTLREYLEAVRPPVGRMVSDDPGLDADLDYPEDHERLRPRVR